MSRKIKSPIRQQYAISEIAATQVNKPKSIYELINEAVEKTAERVKSSKLEYRPSRLLCIDGIVISEDEAINLLS